MPRTSYGCEADGTCSAKEVLGGCLRDWNRSKTVGKKKNGRIMIGYDLGENYAQISYYLPTAEDAETLAVVTGSEQYNIPMVLFKRKDVNQWLYGKDAVRAVKEQEGEPVENLLELAHKGETVIIEEESFDPVALLTLFVKRSLSMLNIVAPPEYLDGVMFTVEKLDERMVDVLSQMAANLQLKTDKIYFQSHVDSFYYFTLSQPEPLWAYEVLLCEYDNLNLRLYRLECNRKTTPKVVFIEVDERREMQREEDENGELPKEGLDDIFSRIVKEKCNGRAVSSVYLIGDGYRDGWAEESLRYLCRGRRVFQGNNLYSKGACYSICEKFGLRQAKEGYIFLGKDKLTANVGMRLLRQGRESYFAIMDGGVNWYDAKKEFDIILETGDSVAILLTPLNGGEPREISVVLDGIPERENWTSRLRVKAQMLSRTQFRVHVTDMGFGDIFASSGTEWEKRIEIV